MRDDSPVASYDLCWGGGEIVVEKEREGGQ